MAIKLGEMLIEAGKLTRPQLEETLKSQVIFGGRLGTNLIEMGYLEEEDLTQFLSKKLGFPYATPEQLMAVPQEVIKIIPREIAEKYKVIPLSRDKKRLTLAMLDPADLSAIDAISFITGYYIAPMIAPELRLVLALEKYYDIKRDVRYIQIAGSSRGRKSVDKSQPAMESRGVEEPDLIDLSLQEAVDDFKPEVGKRVEPSIAVKPVEVEPLALQEPDLIDFSQQQEAEEIYDELEVIEPAAEPVREEPTRAEPARVEPVKAEPVKTEPPRHTIDSVSAELAEARDREEIADVIVAFLGQEFERVALFMVRGANASGWRAVRNKKGIPGIEDLQIPLDGPSVLKVVADGKSLYMGPVPDTPGNAQMLTGIGGGTPSSTLLIPLMMMGRVVTIVYVDGAKEPLSERLTDLQKLVAKAAMAFEILILKNKILMT
jgi:Type II secretion system (T2SS), protein E, N-terminal domain